MQNSNIGILKSKMLYMYFCFSHTYLHPREGTHSARRTTGMLVGQLEDQIIRSRVIRRPIWAGIE